MQMTDGTCIAAHRFDYAVVHEVVQTCAEALRMDCANLPIISVGMKVHVAGALRLLGMPRADTAVVQPTVR